MGEYWEQLAIYSRMAIAAAMGNLKKLSELIDCLDNLPPSAQEQLLLHFRSDAVIKLPDEERTTLWAALVDLLTKHKKFSDVAWAMKPEQIDNIASIADSLAPGSPAFRHQRLFSENDFHLWEKQGNYEEQRDDLELRRQRAIEEVAADGGAEGVLKFAVTVQSAWRVGIAYGVVAGLEIDKVILPDLLECEQKQLRQFAGGFILSRFRTGGWQYVDGIDTTRWTPSQIGEFLSLLPFVLGTWERSARLLGTDEELYWSKTSANPYDTDTGLERAIDNLILYGRPMAALRCIHKMLQCKQPLDGGRSVRALWAALESTESTPSVDGYAIREIIQVLQQDPTTKPDDLFRVEWAYLDFLSHDSGAAPKLLERRLATEPAFFCEIIQLAFTSKKVERPPEEATEERKRYATNVYRLLSNWRTPPGFQADGTFDGDSLDRWLNAVKTECLETGHLEIAMTMVGHVLTHVPSDPDGLWIHRSAASALNAKDANDLRSGFVTELSNSRGRHWMDPTGAPERELATKYRVQAEAVDSAGYPRLATTLRKLVASYEHEAERVISSERFDE